MLIYFDNEIIFPAFRTAKSGKSQMTLQESERVLYNAVKLLGNLRKVLI